MVLNCTGERFTVSSGTAGKIKGLEPRIFNNKLKLLKVSNLSKKREVGCVNDILYPIDSCCGDTAINPNIVNGCTSTKEFHMEIFFRKVASL